MGLYLRSVSLNGILFNENREREREREGERERTRERERDIYTYIIYIYWLSSALIVWLLEFVKGTTLEDFHLCQTLFRA